MNSCCSTSKQDEGKEQIFPNPMMLPLSFQPFSFTHSIPFFRQPNHNFPLLLEASKAVCHVQESISRNIDKCMKLVEKIASQHGFLERITPSLSSHLQAGFQFPRLNSTVVVPSSSSFAAILPGDSVAGVVVTNGILNFLNIYNTLLVVRLVLTWFPNAPPAIVSPLSTLCDPYLNIFRGIIPPLGGTLDLSPILAFLVLNAFTSTASALPAELPSSSQAVPSPTIASNLTAAQQKWIKRLSGKKF